MRQIKIYAGLSVIALTLLNSCRNEEDYSTSPIQNQGAVLKSSLKNNTTSTNESTSSVLVPTTQDTLKIITTNNLMSEEIDSDNNPQNMPPIK